MVPPKEKVPLSQVYHDLANLSEVDKRRFFREERTSVLLASLAPISDRRLLADALVTLPKRPPKRDFMSMPSASPQQNGKANAVQSKKQKKSSTAGETEIGDKAGSGIPAKLGSPRSSDEFSKMQGTAMDSPTADDGIDNEENSEDKFLKAYQEKTQEDHEDEVPEHFDEKAGKDYEIKVEEEYQEKSEELCSVQGEVENGSSSPKLGEETLGSPTQVVLLSEAALGSLKEEKALLAAGNKNLVEFLDGLEYDVKISLHENPYNVTISKATSMKYKTQKAESLYKTVYSVLEELPNWSISKIVPRVFSLLRSYQTMQDIQMSTVNVREDIKRQTRTLMATNWNDVWGFVMSAWTHYEIASTINDAELVDSLGRSGHGAKSYIYDLYVRAEYPHDEAYNAAAKDKLAMQRKREVWLKRKAIGDSITTFIDEFGAGVLLCFPRKTKITTISQWTKVRPWLMIHGLKHGPESKPFKILCDLLKNLGTKLLRQEEMSIIKPLLEEVVAEVPRVLIELTAERISESSPEIDPVKLIIGLLPKSDHQESLQPGWIPNTCPVEDGLLHLCRGRYLGDMVIRVILSLELADLNDATLHVTDPSFFNLDWSSRRHLSIPEQAVQIILPIHHGTHYQHWSVAVISQDEGKIRHLDSNSYSSQNQLVVTKIRELLETVALKDSRFNKKWQYDAEEVMQQRGPECGVHAIENAMACMRRQDPPTRLDPAKLRVQYAQRIMTAMVKQFGLVLGSQSRLAIED